MSRKSVLSAALCCLAAVFICSCSSHSEGASFISSLDSIDAYISQNSAEDALRSLKKLGRKAYTSYEHLGVYKRYMLLGETEPAERILKRGIKKLGKDAELCAVYANFLLRQDRLEDAFSVSQALENSPYASLYAECVLRKALVSMQDGGDVLEESFQPVSKRKKRADEIPAQRSADEIKDIFCSPAFIPVYESAFKGSQDSLWIFNAASVLMRSGEYKKAASLYPQKIASSRESLFWGCVFFDAGMYGESLETLSASRRLAALDGDPRQSDSVQAEIRSLEADGLHLAGEDAQAEEVRQEIMSLAGGTYAAPLVYMNSALYARRNSDLDSEYSRLDFLAAAFPSYIPGIAASGEFALEQLKQPPEDYLTLHLRESGLKTRGMEKKDRIPSVSVESVIERIDSLLEQDASPALVVLRNELLCEQNKIQKNVPPVSSIWSMLEKSASGTNVYPPEIAEYCVQFLLDEGLYDDAKSLFESCYAASHDYAPEENPGALSLRECETAAWFYCKEGNFSAGMKLYRFIADTYGDRLPSLNSSEKNASVINAFVNLGVLYASMDKTQEALSALNKASAKALDGAEKAEILFRIAELSWNSGDSYSASRALKYALSLNPGHNRARLLQKKISAEKNAER